MRRGLRGILATLAACACAHASAQGVKAEVEMRDPWVPPALAKSAQALPKSVEGAALNAEVQRKLRADFEAAAGPDRRLTRDEARVGGLGLVAREFSSIDRAGAGSVSFEDYLAFLRGRGAPFLE